MLAPTVFSEYAPHFRRALGAAPIVALLCGTGLAVILGRRSGAPGTRPEAVPARLRDTGIPPEELAADMDRLAGIGRAMSPGRSSSAARRTRPQPISPAGATTMPSTTPTTRACGRSASTCSSLPPDEPVYVTPRPATDMTLAFAWREGRPVRHFDGRHAFIAAPLDRPATYIVIDHEDFRGGRLLQELYPAAVETKTFYDRGGKVYARAFRVDAGAPPARQPKVSVPGRWPGIDLLGYDLDRADIDRATSSTSSFGGGQRVVRTWTGLCLRTCWARPKRTAAWFGRAGCAPRRR